MSKVTKTKSAYITRSESFAAMVMEREGKKVLVMNSPIWYQHQLNKYKVGQTISLYVDSKRAKRTEQQNRYYWGAFLPEIAKETGEHDLEALHELFKGKFLSEGIVEVLGEKVRKKGSTTNMGIGEFSEFIMNVEALTGVAAPPTDSYGLEPLRKY